MANGITRYYPHPEVVQLIFGQLLSDFVIDVIINDIVSQINNFQAMLQASRSDRKILAHFFHNT